MSQKRNHAEFSAGSSVTEEKTLVGAKSHAVAKRNKNRVAKRKPAIFMNKDEDGEGDWDGEVGQLKDNESAPECACKLDGS
ncbi:hypothetical protein sscle_15g107030 [Sclerotinia sclerotiorum 1980 UF-70]|uniref:Uncharacterized protein n=1 Tax=Sclerotinia sclerotiorum (strain ATCC 18683 / 1980 / Ss-1) TaxID=665079 RepID=A0A1D9QMZ0_SCLS1|nr:hypothetical protein sscle_15g107030 [Sclerotinia sclerotiorum 1980 UF-70]